MQFSWDFHQNTYKTSMEHKQQLENSVSKTNSSFYTRLTLSNFPHNCSASLLLPSDHINTNTRENKRRKVKVNERCVSHLVLRHPPQMETLIIPSLFLSSPSPGCILAPGCLPCRAPLPLDKSCTTSYLHISATDANYNLSVCVCVYYICEEYRTGFYCETACAWSTETSAAFYVKMISSR